MIGYVTVGTNNLEKAVAFYDALLAGLGAGRFMEEDTFVAWAVAPDQPAFSVCRLMMAMQPRSERHHDRTCGGLNRKVDAVCKGMDWVALTKAPG